MPHRGVSWFKQSLVSVLCLCGSREEKDAVLYTYRETRAPRTRDGCTYCLSPHETAGLICFTELWRVRLNAKQAHIGACLVYTARHALRVSDLTAAELVEFQTVMSRLERALENAFGAVLLNYSCWMNYAFRGENAIPPRRDGAPSPHVHWQIHPRYDRPVHFAGESFDDPTFGAPYIIGRDREIKPETLAAIRHKLIEEIEPTELSAP